MPGTIAGGKAAAKTNKRRYGGDYYSMIGAAGGTKSRGGGWASNKVGKDGLTGRERAKVMGKRGGIISKRPKNA